MYMCTCTDLLITCTIECRAGSLTDGTKVGKCDEFAFLCVFKNFQVSIDKHNPMYCVVKPPAYIWESENKWSNVFDYAGRIDPTKFLSTFSQILESKVSKSYHRYSNKKRACFQSFIFCQTKPSYTKYGFKYLSIDKSGRFPKIVTKINGVRTTVDLAPVFEFKQHNDVTLYALTKNSLLNSSMPVDFFGIFQ